MFIVIKVAKAAAIRQPATIEGAACFNLPAAADPAPSLGGCKSESRAAPRQLQEENMSVIQEKLGV